MPRVILFWAPRYRIQEASPSASTSRTSRLPIRPTRINKSSHIALYWTSSTAERCSVRANPLPRRLMFCKVSCEISTKQMAANESRTPRGARCMDCSQSGSLTSQQPFLHTSTSHILILSNHISFTTYDSRADISFVLLDLSRLHGRPAEAQKNWHIIISISFCSPCSWAFRESFSYPSLFGRDCTFRVRLVALILV